MTGGSLNRGGGGGGGGPEESCDTGRRVSCTNRAVEHNVAEFQSFPLLYAGRNAKQRPVLRSC